jgi:tRNA(adenine34) deaminase
MVQESIFGAKSDCMYMEAALEQATYAANCNEVPIGAVLVDGAGIIVSRGYNATEQQHSQMAHAELSVLRTAGAARGDWRLSDCWLYVTLEPCIMCMGGIYLSRLAGLVYGATSPLFGSQLDNAVLLPVYKINALRIISGVCAQESAALLKKFFRAKRSGNGEYQ